MEFRQRSVEALEGSNKGHLLPCEEGFTPWPGGSFVSDKRSQNAWHFNDLTYLNVVWDFKGL